LQTIRNAISNIHLGIEILRDLSSPGLDIPHRQIISLFKEAGWIVHDWVPIGGVTPPNDDLTLFIGPQTRSDAVNSIVAGFGVAGLPLEVRQEGDSERIMPRLYFSAARD